MFPTPVANLRPNSLAFENAPLIKATGFREYDTRWWYGVPGSAEPPELNLMGATALGLGFGTLLGELGVRREVVVAHDYRAYSSSIKMALVAGLLGSGCRVHDIGMAMTPMAYFAQFALDVPAVAMVTASHNENGWTGVKMGSEPPYTFGPEVIARLKEIVYSSAFTAAPGGEYVFVERFAERYVADLTSRPKFRRPMKVVAACGNGTPGPFAPRILSALGVDVIPLDAELDYTFPKYNPNPEDLVMLAVIAETVVGNGADLGLGFDGDGDRCGVVDETGEAIFADKIGVLLARDLSGVNPGAVFVADIKSTGLFATDPVLKRNGAVTEYWKTGHSYIKRRVGERGALAGFEKSGHFFFNAPIGRGYDDGVVSAIAVLDMLDRKPDMSMSDLRESLPRTWGSPTMAAHCPDEDKYALAERVERRFAEMQRKGESLAGHAIAELVTINGVRVRCDDGTWGLVRASSNKPELIVVIESPVSEARLRDMFAAVDRIVRNEGEVGSYNQTI